MSALLGSVESVVLPVPLSPKKSETSPFARPMLQPEWRLSWPHLGIR